MKALVNTLDQVSYYTLGTPETDVDGNVIYQPRTQHPIASSARICQIEEDNDVFEVHPSLIWVDCNASINTREYYYDTADSTIKLIPTS